MQALQFLQRFTLTHKLILASLLGLISYNFIHLTIHDFVQKDQTLVPLEPGIQFAEFKTHLKNVREIGFISDQSTQDEFFYQAQYYLAPTVLKYDDSHYEFNIIDSINIPFILKNIVDTKSIRLLSTEYGQALIRRKNP